MIHFLKDCRTILRCRYAALRTIQRNTRGELPDELADERIFAIHEALMKVRKRHWSRGMVIDLLNASNHLAPGVRLLLIIAMVVTLVRWL